MKKILLTGHHGFLGQHLYKAFSETENEVYGLDAATYSDFMEQLRSMDEQHVYFDYVVHCGAICDSQRQDNLLWQMNYQATCDIATFCEKKNIKLIFISSCVAQNPDTPYGWSKKCSEYFLSHTCVHQCILRPYNIWGFDESEKGAPSIVWKVLTGTLPVIYKGCVRDFVFVEDVVSAVVSVTKQWVPGIHEIGTGVPTKIETFFEN